jgi:hypothetical protein
MSLGLEGTHSTVQQEVERLSHCPRIAVLHSLAQQSLDV